MDIQGFLPNKEERPVPHYSEMSNDRLNLPSTSEYKTSSSIPTILPTLVEEEDDSNLDTVSMVTPQQQQQQDSTSSSSKGRDHLNPALLLSSANRFDKRKSSPAILGLPFGLNHEAQLSLHLSQQRNSIEAAMLLANFNKLMAFPKANELDHHHNNNKAHGWQDDMSIPSQNKNSWGDVLSNESETNRRYSYDVNMSWQTMPESFLDRSDLLNNINTTTTDQPSSSASTDAPILPPKQENNMPTKVTWSHEDIHHSHHPHSVHPHSSAPHPYASVEYSNHPVSPRQHARLYHPSTMNSPLTPHHYPRFQPPPPPPPPHHHPQQDHPHHGVPMLHPLARQPDGSGGVKIEPQPFYSYTFPPQRYYYPTNGKLPLPSQQQPSSMEHHPPPLLAKPKRKKQKANNTNNGASSTVDFEEEMVETNEEDYPDMSARDIEAARTDPEARPRKQKLRFVGDQYTPSWVRYNGQLKEGLCDTCKPGKWLQLKNSAYWYHKQFYHGISSVSGKEFVQPVETRWVDQDLVEGLCHQCHTWVAVSNVKRKNSVLWYRHAHKCHVYHKPKQNVPKKR